MSILVGAALARFLPTAPAEAAVLGMMVSFLVFTAVTLWVYAVHHLRQVWLTLGIVIVLLGAVVAGSIVVDGRL